MRQGDDGNDFFILVEGKVVVTQTTEKGETGIVAELLPAQYFGSLPSLHFSSLLSSINNLELPLLELIETTYFSGEIALLTHEQRRATVTATGPVKCVKLDRERFERVLGPCETILRRDMSNYKKYEGK